MAIASELLMASSGVKAPRTALPHSTRRLATVAVAVSVVVGTIAAAGPGGSPVASAPGAPRAVVMRPGETLWDVAEEHAPTGVDPRAYVDALIEINGVAGGVQPGERIRLPR